MNDLKFEYKIYEFDNESLWRKDAEKEINSFGLDGWELVSLIPFIRDNEESSIKEIHFFFKRALGT